MDVIKELIAKPFSCRSWTEKKTVLQSSRPTPKITTTKMAETFRQVDIRMYNGYVRVP